MQKGKGNKRWQDYTDDAEESHPSGTVSPWEYV
jgi:hypothetical protein